MAVGTIHHIEQSVHKTNKWIKDVMEEIGWDNKEKAYTALRATLQVLRDRLPIDEVAALGAQLPLVLRGVFYEGWDPTGKPERIDKLGFIIRIHAYFNNDPTIKPDVVANKVIAVLRKKISEGEMKDIKSTLPPDINSLI